MKKDTPVTVRLTSNESERFKQMAHDNYMSQAQLLVKMMDSFGSPQNSAAEHDQCVTIVLGRKNSFAPLDKKQNMPTEKVIFPAEILYWPKNYFTYPAVNYADELHDDFLINKDLSIYCLQYVLNLVLHKEKGRFVINEVIRLVDNDNPQNMPLVISRCAFVNTFDEVYKKFGKYADANNLADIEVAMAKDIGDNYARFNDYF